MPDERTIPKTPPHSDDAEQSVIGSMLMDREAVEFAAENLSKEDFYSTRNGLIFDALKAIYRDGRSCDLVTLKDQLEASGHLDEVGDMKNIWAIVEAVPTSANVKNYVKIVKDNALYRRFISLGNTIVTNGYSREMEIDDLSNKVEQDVYKILSERTSTDFQSIADILPESLTDMQTAFANGGKTGGIPSGFKDLDAILMGFNPSDLIIIGARPAMGKSAFALNIMTHMAVKEHKSVAMFSLEMSGKQMVNRILASYAGIKLGDIRTGNLGNDWQTIGQSMADLAGARMFFDDNGGCTISEIRTKCRKLKLEQGLDAVFVDYLQLMNGSNAKSDGNRIQEISEISRGLKLLARELNIPIFALSQLSRSVESRTDKRPMMSDLRDSGSIEQDADIVLFLYRDEYYHPDTEDKNIGEVIITKHRMGETGTVKLRYDGEYTRFANLAR